MWNANKQLSCSQSGIALRSTASTTVQQRPQTTNKCIAPLKPQMHVDYPSITITMIAVRARAMYVPCPRAHNVHMLGLRYASLPHHSCQNGGSAHGSCAC